VASSFQATAYNGTPHAPGPDGTPRSAKEHGGSFQTPDRTGIALLMMRPGRGPDRRKCKCCLKLFRSLIAATNASAYDASFGATHTVGSPSMPVRSDYSGSIQRLPEPPKLGPNPYPQPGSMVPPHPR
jgi:hypothetical protein